MAQPPAQPKRKRAPKETIPTECIFAVAYELTRRGVLSTDEAAAMIGYTRRGAELMLNRAVRRRVVARSAVDQGGMICA